MTGNIKIILILSLFSSCSRDWSNPLNPVGSNSISTDGLVAYYPFNGNANDESGNGSNGTVIGPILATDRHGHKNSAYNFDGIDDYIIARSNNLPAGERTISAWVFAQTLYPSKPQSVLLAYGGGECGTSMYMIITSNCFAMSSHCDVNSFYYYTSNTTNKWYHFIITVALSGTKIYINGLEKYSNGFYINNTIVNGKDLSFGVDVNWAGIAPYTDSWVTYFNGLIDDIRIYNRVLNDSEIKALYHEGGWDK